MKLPFEAPGRFARLSAGAVLWLAVIGSLHFYLNGEPRRQDRVLMGYMPVVTNLAAPLVDAASKNAPVRFEAVKFASFADMAEAFRGGHIQAAFMIAPLAVVLHRQGTPLKVVYIGNRHESTLVVRKDVPGNSLLDLVGRTIAVPMRYSGHNLAIKRYFREKGMNPDSIRMVELPPPDMAPALASGGIDGYFVGEPFAEKAVAGGIARKLVRVEEIWPEFICNLLIVRQDLIDSYPEQVQTLVGAAARSGAWARDHLEDAIRVACSYWGQDSRLVRDSVSDPPGRIRFDLFVPKVKELEQIAEEMERSGLLAGAPDIAGMVDDQFARSVDVSAVASLGEIMPIRRLAHLGHEETGARRP